MNQLKPRTLVDDGVAFIKPKKVIEHSHNIKVTREVTSSKADIETTYLLINYIRVIETQYTK